MNRTKCDLRNSMLLVFCFMMRPQPAAAVWPTDPLVNVPLCTANGDQVLPISIRDGAGGAIVTWSDTRNGDANSDIYVQRISAAGTVQWSANGVALCAAAGAQRFPVLAPDGAGGAIVVWSDERAVGSNHAVYAQRISAAGAVQWAVDGVALDDNCQDMFSPILADGVGGAFVSWSRDGDIYAQHISSDGEVQWQANGVPLCTAVDPQAEVCLGPDGADGIIAAWVDSRSGDRDIYAQRVSTTGAIQWAVDGVPLCSVSGVQQSPMIVTDGTGGAIVQWSDMRHNTGWVAAYAQRISASGVVQWPTNGVALSLLTQGNLMIVADESGGAIATRAGLPGTPRIYAQRISHDGAIQWMPGGVALCDAVAIQYTLSYPSSWVEPDGAGGAVVVWGDESNGDFNSDIYAQRISADGAVQWNGGVAVSTVTGSQSTPWIVSDGFGGGIVTWSDSRNGVANSDIYAQRVLANGQLGGSGAASVPEASAFSLKSFPNPFNPRTTIAFELAEAGAIELAIYDLGGRLVRVVDSGSRAVGRYQATWDGQDNDGRAVPTGTYFCRLNTAQGSQTKKMTLAR
jgi:hypothetical protein